MSVSKDQSASIVFSTYKKNPSISIVIPTYNEIENIEAVVNSFLSSNYPNLLEEFFLRADAHCEYAPDYIEQCVAAFEKSQALNVGGCQRFVAKEPFQAAIAIAARSWLGNGGAKYRDPNYSGYADTVYLGCFKKEVLLELNSLPTQLVLSSQNLEVSMDSIF